MKYIIDTSSLISLARNFLVFDSENVLYEFFEKKFRSGEFILIDKVYTECDRTAKGLVLDKMQFLKLKENIFKTDEIFPSQKFFNQLDSQFINGRAKASLKAAEYQAVKNIFLESADCKLILMANQDQDFTIVTEETKSNNDGKGFKKIPAICEILKIPVITFPELLHQYSKDVSIKYHK